MYVVCIYIYIYVYIYILYQYIYIIYIYIHTHSYTFFALIFYFALQQTERFRNFRNIVLHTVSFMQIIYNFCEEVVGFELTSHLCTHDFSRVIRAKKFLF